MFVGRWSMQKGIDLIADVFPSVLEENPKAQLICIGPVIDIYGKFAALKLRRLMELYPDRVCSKPEFTVLPPYIFSGAEFALIPSRDEPFGLVAVEFGRKGALGVGSRVGGLGNMPGWWFTIESVASKHLISQFQKAIKDAMNTPQHTRAEMRAMSALQRFPVAQWLDGLEKLQSGSIAVHQRVKARAYLATGASTPSLLIPLPSAPGTALTSPVTTRPSSRIDSRVVSSVPSRASSPTDERTQDSDQISSLPPNRHANHPVLASLSLNSAAMSPTSTAPASPTALALVERGNAFPPLPITSTNTLGGAEPGEYFIGNDLRENLGRALVSRHIARQNSQDSGQLSSSSSEARQTSEESRRAPSTPSPAASTQGLGVSPSILSLESVVGDEKKYRMQKVEPFFTDSQGVYTRRFNKLLGGLNGRTSTKELSIEDFITKSEKDWFGRFHNAKLGFKSYASKATAISSGASSSDTEVGSGSSVGSDTAVDDEFELGQDYIPPRGLKRIVQYRIRDWPVYAFLLALGQIMSANSYQVTLLCGEIGQAAAKLYVVATIYLVASILWWTLFRLAPSRYVIALPFLVYALALFTLGMAPYAHSDLARGWTQNLATGLYALASGSGSLFFTLNFGSEGGSAPHTWVFRACMVQGIHQAYIALMWYWGARLAAQSAAGTNPTGIAASSYITAVTTPLALLLVVIGIALFVGLPDFYRSAPGNVPSFYLSLRRRKTALWFFLVVILQNYFLSAPYGRNWRYLWSSAAAPSWSIAALAALFFGPVWAALCALFARLSREHTWILPLFALGLGAPRWAQMLWGTSGIGLYVPWAGGPAVGALVGRALWLWLGVLDALQGVGLGMVLLQTLTRLHVAFTLTAAQVLGSVATILARATAPDRLGPGAVFPNLALGTAGLYDGVFWVALGLQGVGIGGFLLFFRKEQLFKP